MEKLKDKFSQERIKRTEAIIGEEIAEKLKEKFGVKSIGDLDLEGWFSIIASSPVEKDEFVKSAVAAGMDVEEYTVDILPAVAGISGIYAEMNVGSHNYPWPEFAKGVLESVNKNLSGSGVVAKIVF